MKQNPQRTPGHCLRNLSSDHSPSEIHRAGFTLVELLVVIAIIAVLAALSFVGYSRFRKSANIAVGISNVRQIGAQWMMFSSDNNGIILRSFGTAVEDWTGDGSIDGADALNWNLQLASMVEELYHHPGSPGQLVVRACRRR